MATMSLGIFIFMLLTLIVLVVGVILMARGGKLNKLYSNKLMVLRVVFQGVALLIVALMFFMAKK